MRTEIELSPQLNPIQNLLKLDESSVIQTESPGSGRELQPSAYTRWPLQSPQSESGLSVRKKIRKEKKANWQAGF